MLGLGLSKNGLAQIRVESVNLRTHRAISFFCSLTEQMLCDHALSIWLNRISI